MEKFIITKDIVKKVRRFNLTGRLMEFRLKAVPKGEDPVNWVKEAVHQVIQKSTAGLQSTDHVGFSFCSKNFTQGNGWIRFRPLELVTYEDVWEMISSIFQSNSTGMNTETFCLGVTAVRMPAGRGRGKKYNTFMEECAMRRGIISINNKDNMCLPRALVVAMSLVNKEKDYNKVRRDIGKVQTLKAQQLSSDAGVVIPETGAGILELKAFQTFLKDYKVVVYTYGSKGRDTIFLGSVQTLKRLNLLYHEGHYNVITSLTAAFRCSYFCEECLVPYNSKNDHRCGGTCPACQQSPTCAPTVQITCADCKRYFRGQTCYDNHKVSICSQIRRCELCFKVVKRERQHVCGEVFCKICKSHARADHMCYMKCDNGTPKTKDLLFIFYDLETRQEIVLEDGSKLHEPNLCVFKQCCSVCMYSAEEICNRCGMKLQILKSDDVISPFIHHILNLRKKFKQVVVIAHNGQAFDHQFCLNYILKKTDLMPELILRGTKITSMIVDNVKFLDSLNYFPMALEKLPTAFALGDNFKKGYFPHLFNTAINANYIGTLPALEYYAPDNMEDGTREKFLNWYETHKYTEFDMQRDLVEYCVSDVEILTQTCLKFREQMLSACNVCPFTEACTIASTCNKVYRRNFLKPNTIGIIPKNGYRWRDNQSTVAIQWLVWEEHQRGINIIHAAKQQEAVVAGIKVDGFCSETNQVFEFHGCYYHGCILCLKVNRDVPLHEDPTRTLNFRYEATVAKLDRIRELGYSVVEMWECDFRRQLDLNNEILAYTKNHPLVAHPPMNPRDAFYGGRTDNTFEYYKCKPGETIKYVDVSSLYPWVCKRGKFPVGHPKVYVDKDCDCLNLEKTDGVIKCKVLPPKNLYHPVLPTKMNKKLMFVLCRTCSEQAKQDECDHSEEQRCLTGTWVIDEVLKAIEMGYKVKKIYEIWAYQVEQYNPTKGIGGLFREMMDKFLKIKQEASGWPEHCVTEEQRNKYIEDFLSSEGIQLKYAEILNNPGLRSLAKLMLNSFWGKLGQRENQPKTVIVRSPSEYFDMMSNTAIYVNSVLPLNDDTLVVNYEHRAEVYDPLTTVNVCLAAYVTAQGRLKLYSYLEQLGDRVLYYDTDSIIYISRKGEYDIVTGDFIGDMTDELAIYGQGSYITEFVSGGPKNYAYKAWSTKTQEFVIVCKVKGISLNHSASQLVNFDTIKNMILKQTDPIYIVSQNICRTKEHQVVTKEQTKIYRTNSTKRRFLSDHSSLPYGYKKRKI